ncbi:MAG: hypothetical protein OEY61_14050 [Gammaproteobacteria bacterium]|nr:hypothetical protein [Gammaproteobacteria bacterium]
MNQNTALTIKVTITLLLAITGIGYIMYTPPTSQVANYEKQPMKKPSTSARIESISDTVSNNADSGDNVSLTGKTGQFEETKIGKSVE